MDKTRIFFCQPQNAYMSINNCGNLRNRPTGKAAAGAQPKLLACERCTMYTLVDKNKVPTVTLKDYVGGKIPAAAAVPA